MNVRFQTQSSHGNKWLHQRYGTVNYQFSGYQDVNFKMVSHSNIDDIDIVIADTAYLIKYCYENRVAKVSDGIILHDLFGKIGG